MLYTNKKSIFQTEGNIEGLTFTQGAKLVLLLVPCLRSRFLLKWLLHNWGEQRVLHLSKMFNEQKRGGHPYGHPPQRCTSSVFRVL